MDHGILAVLEPWFSEKKTTDCFYFRGQIVETLRSRLLGKSRDQGLAVRFDLRFTLVKLDHALEVAL